MLRALCMKLWSTIPVVISDPSARLMLRALCMKLLSTIPVVTSDPSARLMLTALFIKLTTTECFPNSAASFSTKVLKL